MSNSIAWIRKKRIMQEMKRTIDKTIIDNCSVGLVDESVYDIWEAKILGPTGTIFEGGIFTLRIEFPNSYPSSPPKITMLTKMYHPNINDLGQICLNILDTDWVPSLTIIKVLISISSIMSDPNPYDCLNPTASHVFLTDREKYNDIVKYYTYVYASL